MREPCRDNPFGDRGRISDPSRFFDREELLRDIFVELRKGSSLSLVGESQIGKSSLLAMVKHHGPTALAGTGKSFILIDMQSIRDEAEFFEVLCAELGLGLTLRWQGLKRALQHQQVVVCLDEIEKMTHPQAFSWEQRAELRGLAEGQDAPLSLVIASRSPLSDLFPDNPRETSPLAGLCGPPLRVGPFSEAISRAFLRSRLLGHAVQFTEGQIAELHEQSQGHPGRLQSKAAELYRQLVR
jgi:energy-coupling factor transporter ATP-binding protein EcfA2